MHVFSKEKQVSGKSGSPPKHIGIITYLAVASGETKKQDKVCHGHGYGHGTARKGKEAWSSPFPSLSSPRQ